MTLYEAVFSEGSGGLRQVEKRRNSDPGRRAKVDLRTLRSTTAAAVGQKHPLPKSDLGSWEAVRLAKRLTIAAKKKSDSLQQFYAKKRWNKAQAGGNQ